jgi:hypothetical protein
LKELAHDELAARKATMRDELARDADEATRDEVAQA